MSNSIFIIRSFRHFFNHDPIRLMTLFLITLVQGFSQGVTIVLLIPLLSLLDPTQVSVHTNNWTGQLSATLGYVGLELNLGIILAIYTLCLLFIAILNYLQTTMQSKYQQDFSYETRRRLFKKIITSDWAFLNGKSKHNHIQVLTTEIPKMTNYYYFFLSLTSKFIFIMAHVSLALMISWNFTLLVLVMGLAVLLLLSRYIKKAKTMGDVNIQVFRKMLKRIDDFWLTVKIAKVHQSEEFYYVQYDKTNKQMLDNQYQQVKNRSIPQFLFSLAGVLTLVVIVYLGYSVVKIPLASLFVLILLFARIFPQFSGLNSDLNMMVTNEASVRMVLDMDQGIVEQDFKAKQTTEKIGLHEQLDIRDLNFGYSAQIRLFDHFSTSIPAKQITGISGKSGSGKTTLIDIIAGLQKTDHGNILVDGKELTQEKLTIWRQSIGYLPQDSFFIDGTLRENLIWDTKEHLTDENIFEILKQVNAEDLVRNQKNGLDTYIANYQYHFSGGERQRLALARVLLRKPKLLLLDEATSALDPENEKQIMECLTRLKKDVTIVFVTHREYLRSYFDKTINLNRKES
ncbi:MAG: ABC transporter ATP-binding protein [Bacteroidales bacterium]|nr:ABC transporter ATP-binding protein [Bacteroidales bacterium]